MLAALGFIGLLIALVAAVDRILNKETKILIALAVRNAFNNYSDKKLVNRYADKISFVQPFTWKSVKSSFLISLISLGFIIYIQYFTLGYQFSELIKDVPHNLINKYLFFIIFMILSNFVVDFISFTQTMVIINLINKTKDKKSLFVLIFTDLLASINIFTFAYAFFLSIGVLFVYNTEETIKFYISLNDVDASELRQALLVTEANLSGLEQAMNAKVYTEGKETPNDVSSIYVLSSKKLSAPEFLTALKSIQHGSNEQPSTMQIGEGSLVDKYSREGKLNYSISGQTKTLLNVRRSYERWYSQAYILADDVQDNFFKVTGLSPGFQPLEDLRTLSFNQIIELYGDQTFVKWCISEQKIMQINDSSCKDTAIFISNDLSTLKERLARSVEMGGQLPLYTFFFTSLALTFLIYAYYASAIFLSALGYIVRFTSVNIPAYFNIDEHPVTIISMPVILMIGIIYFMLI